MESALEKTRGGRFSRRQRVLAPRFPPLGPHMASMTLPNASARATTALGWLTSSFRNAHEPAVQVEEPEGFS